MDRLSCARFIVGEPFLRLGKEYLLPFNILWFKSEDYRVSYKPNGHSTTCINVNCDVKHRIEIILKYFHPKDFPG